MEYARKILEEDVSVISGWEKYKKEKMRKEMKASGEDKTLVK